MKTLPTPRKQPSQRRSRYTVEVILESAARVLAERGYAATNTNLVARRAGVSIGSLYQYFPNKDALFAALHERHARQIDAIIEDALDPAAPDLGGEVAALVHGVMRAHRLEPRLHAILEKELPFLDAPAELSPADHSIARHLQELLQGHRRELMLDDVEVASWGVLRIMEAMIHGAVITPPRGLDALDAERATVRAILGFLLWKSPEFAAAEGG